MLGKREREEILAAIGNTPVCIPALHGLAMKADLNLPWKKIANTEKVIITKQYCQSSKYNNPCTFIKRWLKEWGVQIENERKLQTTSQDLVSTDIQYPSHFH